MTSNKPWGVRLLTPRIFSAGRRRGSSPDPAQRPDQAERTPGGSPAAGPPVMAATAASARDSRAVTYRKGVTP